VILQGCPEGGIYVCPKPGKGFFFSRIVRDPDQVDLEVDA